MSTVIEEKQQQSKPGKVKRPPVVSAPPLVGSLVPMLNNPLEYVNKCYKNYGEIFRFKVAHRSYVVMGGIDALRFFGGEGKDCFNGVNFWGKAQDYMKCPHMLVGVDGEMHKHQRDALKPLISKEAYLNRIEDLAGPVQEIIDNTKDGVFDVGPGIRHIFSNQIGYNLQGYKPDYNEVVEFIYYFGGVMNVYGLRKWPELMLRTPRFLKAKALAKKHARKVIEISEQRTPEEVANKPLMMDVMLPKLREKPEWFGKGEEEMYGLLPFVAALDTIGASTGFMIQRLLENPDLYQRIQKEVDEVFSKGLPDSETLLAMEDLNGLCKETLRLQPTGFGMTRTATKDFVFKGYQVYKGEDVLIFTTADHRNKNYFPDPMKFDIERYREPRNEHRTPVYAPFAKGAHSCLGAGMTELMMPLNMGLILYNWDLSPACDMKKVKMTFNPAPVLSNNFKIKVQKRKHL